jgi:site-specific DNA-adenine methylase
MNKNHFFFAYPGNKRQEFKYIHDTIKNNINDINIIVEPYCGSCAVSYNLSVLYPGKFEYIINDNNKLLIELINISKDDIKYNKLIDDVEKYFIKCNTKEKYDNIYKTDKSLEAYIFFNIYYAIRAGFYPLNKQINQVSRIKLLRNCPFLNFIRTEKIKILCDDAINVIETYKNNDNTLIFLDPPYLSVCNGFYKTPIFKIYDYIFKNSDDINNNKTFFFILFK